MKRTIAIILALITAATTLCACGDPTQATDDENLSLKYKRSTDTSETYNYTDGARETPNSYSVYSSEITDFELRMFRNYYSIETDGKSSFVITPVNSVIQLGLLANGASKDSLEEILKALGNDLTLDNINQCSSYFKSRIQAVADSGEEKIDQLTGKKITSDNTSYVKLENDLFFNDNLDVKTKFLQNNSDYYGTNVFRFMFSDENSLTKLNNCFSYYSTDGILEKLDESQNLISVTASDICDTWLESYAQEDVTKGTFKSSNGDTDVNYMTSSESFFKSDSAQGIIKYTKATPLKMMLVMPNEDISLEDYVKDFNNLEYNNLLESIDITKKATAKIPEFSIDSDGKAKSLSASLTKSGLYTLFTEDSTFANLTNSDDFALNEMYEISPEITVNAAGIGGIESNGNIAQAVKRTKELEETDTTIEFNRPFIFLIIDNESSIPLYIGTVTF